MNLITQNIKEQNMSHFYSSGLEFKKTLKFSIELLNIFNYKTSDDQVKSNQ